MKCLISFVLIIFGFKAFSQINETFSDGNLNENPLWQGDIGHFEINSDKILQLKAPAAGSTTLYTEVIFPDSFELSYYLKMAFAPSASNYARIFLGDNADVNLGNGYLIEKGENGSGDAVRFFLILSGNRQLIASGREGSLANDPAECNLQLSYTNGGEWTVNIDYNDLGTFDDKFQFTEKTITASQLKYFVLRYDYTATRVDKFFFDDLILKKYELDTKAPNVTSIEVINDRALVVSFDETLDETSAENASNYEIDNGIGSAKSALLQNPSKVLIDLINPLLPSVSYTVNVKNVKDKNGNAINPAQSKTISIIAKPKKGDILINELLFDPYINGEDFVEIINTSNNEIDITNLVIANLQKGEQKILSKMTLLPSQIVAFTEDSDALISIYQPPSEVRIIQTDLPSFNNDQGNVSLIYDGIVLDSFDYDESMHQSQIDDTEGVSLERVDLLTGSNVVSNWQSSSKSVRYATPGYKNSVNIPSQLGEDEFELIQKVFSPNGENKLMIVRYNLDNPGYLANVAIYDSEGYLVKRIAENELLGSTGIFTWDGSNIEGIIQRLGMYIVVGELYNANFSTKKFKKVCVLADFLD